MNTSSERLRFASGGQRPEGVVVTLGRMPSAAAADVHLAVQSVGVPEHGAAARLEVLFVGAEGWPEGRTPAVDADACVLLFDAGANAARAAALAAPVLWVRQPWPCEPWALDMALRQAIALGQEDRFGVAGAGRDAASVGDDRKVPALPELLARIDVYEFQYELATARRRPAPWDLVSIGSSPTTFHDILEGVHPDDRPLVAAAYSRSNESGCAYEVVFRWRHPDGSYRWREARAAVSGWTGPGTGVLHGISRDVDDALRARAGMERLHRQIAHALAAARMIEWEWSGSGTRRWLGSGGSGDASPLHGSDLDDWIHPDDRDSERAAFESAVACGRRHEAEVRLLDPFGSWRWMRLVGDPQTDEHGALSGYMGIGIDVSERRRLDADLSRAELSLARTLVAARAYVVEWDAATGARTTTGPAVEILGCDPQRIGEALALIHPDDRAEAEALAQRILRDGRAYACEYRVRRADGRLVWIRAQGAPVVSDSGEVVGTAGICLDVTAHRDVEERLVRLSRQCDVALAAAGLSPWSVDVETGRYESGIGEVGHFGPGIATREQLVAAVHVDDRPAFINLFSDDFLVSQQPLSIEVRVPAADGSVRWITVVARSVCDAQGRPRELIGISRDVTESHRSRVQLVEALDRLDRVLEATGALLWEWRRDQGLSLGGAPGLDDRARAQVVVHPADRSRLLRRFARCMRTGATLDIEVRLKAGRGWRWVSVQGRLARTDKGVEVFSGMAIDITRRKQAEAEQHESALWRRAAASIVDLNLWRVDVRSGVRVGGEQDRHWYGRDIDSIDEFMRLIAPEDVERFDRELRRSLAQRCEFDSEIAVISPARGRRLLRLRAVPMDVGDPDEDVWVGATLDVTEQRRHEQELEMALAVARDASIAKSAFLAAVSHEMRTPLNAVIGYSGLLSSMQVGVEASFHLRALQAGANQLLAVINDVLDFSRMEAGSLTLERVPFDPLACVEGSLDLIAVTAEEKGICLSLGCDRVDWPLLFGDATRLRQIALNLLSNAVKFTARGAVSMSVSRDGEPGNESFVLTVEDTGIGMSEETRSRLFMPFRQGDESMARRFGGSGLGLSITSRLVAIMHGSIDVWSSPGKGSRFTVRLPWAYDAAWPSRHLVAFDGVRIGVCIASTQLREAICEQLRVFGAVPVMFDAASDFAEVCASVDALVIGARMYVHWRQRADYASIDGRVAMVVLAGFADAHTLRGEVESVVVASRSIKPSELNAALVRALGQLSMPQADDIDAAAGPVSARNDAIERMGISILIVEDNEVNQLLLQAQLASLGYNADLAAGGEEAIAALRTRAYDAVLMDLEMPGMDGLQTASAIRAMTDIVGPQPRIIAVSAHVFAEMEARIRTAGMDDFVPKPVIIESLAAAVARIPVQPH